MLYTQTNAEPSHDHDATFINHGITIHKITTHIQNVLV